jgi:hypothetical protein
MSFSFNASLEAKCPACDASGISDPRDGDGPCWFCDGIGYKLTDFGDAVFQAMRRHKPWEEK